VVIETLLYSDHYCTFKRQCIPRRLVSLQPRCYTVVVPEILHYLFTEIVMELFWLVLVYACALALWSRDMFVDVNIG